LLIGPRAGGTWPFSRSACGCLPEASSPTSPRLRLRLQVRQPVLP
jgi:hypothetical protein